MDSCRQQFALCSAGLFPRRSTRDSPRREKRIVTAFGMQLCSRHLKAVAPGMSRVLSTWITWLSRRKSSVVNTISPRFGEPGNTGNRHRSDHSLGPLAARWPLHFHGVRWRRVPLQDGANDGGNTRAHRPQQVISARHQGAASVATPSHFARANGSFIESYRVQRTGYEQNDTSHKLMREAYP